MYSCTSCASPYVNINGACVAKCTFPCKSCKTFPDFCTECVSGYKLDGSFCLLAPTPPPPPPAPPRPPSIVPTPPPTPTPTPPPLSSSGPCSCAKCC